MPSFKGSFLTKGYAYVLATFMQGDPADGRMMKHAAKRGVKLTSISRPVVRSDFENFDVILAMDENNQREHLAAGSESFCSGIRFRPFVCQ